MKNKSEKRLQKASLHVLYEYKMLVCTLVNPFPEGSDDYWGNVKIEIYLIHARTLLEFFSKNVAYSDDIRCCDFISDTCKLTTLTNTKQAINDKIKMMNKHLAHLTEVRLDNPVTNWPPIIIEITEVIAHKISQFMKFADPKSLDPAWRNMTDFDLAVRKYLGSPKGKITTNVSMATSDILSTRA